MQIRRAGLTLFLGALSIGSALAQESSFGPRPIYLRGSAFAWEFTFEQQVDEVFKAAVKVGKKHGLKPVTGNGGSDLLRLARIIQKGGVLDKHCRFPIVSYYSWEQTETYAQVQSAAFGQRMRGESMGQAGRLNGAVNILIHSRGEGIFAVQSICSAFLRKWGVVEATPLGVVEKAFLEDLVAALGTSMEVPIPDAPMLEPSREDPKRDLHVADQCQERCVPGSPCTGMFVDPSSLELQCVGGLP